MSLEYGRRAFLIKLYTQCQKVTWKAIDVGWGIVVAMIITSIVAPFVAVPMMLVTAELTGLLVSPVVGLAAGMCMMGTTRSVEKLNM